VGRFVSEVKIFFQTLTDGEVWSGGKKEIVETVGVPEKNRQGGDG
jgi:hypothetical protein